MLKQPRQLSFDDLPQPVSDVHAPLTYVLERSPRRTSSVRINVEADLSVRVIAPMRLAKATIDAMVRAREAWIRKRRDELRSAHVQRAERQWVSGDRLPFLDEMLELRIVRQEGRRMLDAVREGPYLVITIPADLNGTEPIIRIVHKWYAVFARRTFIERCKHYGAQLGVQPSNVLVRNQESRWGSCAHDGTLRFCWRLVLGPQRVLDYVVVHELSHLLHPHHQRPFWNTVGSILPSYKELRDELKRDGEKYRL